MKPRLSLRLLLGLVLVGGMTLGLTGRYLLRDVPRYICTTLSDRTTAQGYFQRNKPNTPPYLIVLTPSRLVLSFGYGGGAPFNFSGNDYTAISHHGVLQFNGKPVPIQPGRRVFLYTTGRRLVPLEVDDQLLAGVTFDNFKGFADTKVYQTAIADAVAAETRRQQEADFQMYKEKLPIRQE